MQQPDGRWRRIELEDTVSRSLSSEVIMFFYYQFGLRGTKQCVIGLYGESFGVQAVQRNGSAKDSDIQNRKSSDES